MNGVNEESNEKFRPGIRLDEGVALARDDRGRDRFPIEFPEFRLVVEKFQLARGANHVQEDDPFGLGFKRCWQGRKWVVRRVDRLPSASVMLVARMGRLRC